MGGKTVKEVCKLYAPCRIDFLQEDGTTIGNYVSRGPAGELMMTYVFQWKVKGEIGEGEEERFAGVSYLSYLDLLDDVEVEGGVI
jgi:hypothetical protein